MTRGGAGWPGRRPDDCFAAPARCVADESVSEANQISGEPYGEPARADDRRRTATSSDEQRSHLALQTIARDVPRQFGHALQAMSTREPISDAHRELGDLLRKARKAANLTTRDIINLSTGQPFSSGHISNVENRYTMPSSNLIAFYEQLGADRPKLRAAAEAARKATEGKRRIVSVTQQREAVTSNSDPKLLRSLYESVNFESTHYIDSRGVITHEDTTHFIRALDPTRYYVRSSIYYSDRRRSVN
jgi:hypothetical protein